MKKPIDPLLLLPEEARHHHEEYGFAVVRGRRIRYVEREGCIDVAEADDTFDRWANSVDFSFEVHKASGQRQFLRWLEEEGEDSDAKT